MEGVGAAQAAAPFVSSTNVSSLPSILLRASLRAASRISILDGGLVGWRGAVRSSAPSLLLIGRQQGLPGAQIAPQSVPPSCRQSLLSAVLANPIRSSVRVNPLRVDFH